MASSTSTTQATAASAAASSTSSTRPGASSHVSPPIDTGATTRYSMTGLFQAVKGELHYHTGEAFLLHVYWECPSMDSAHRLLSALNQCARATHINTPTTPTYFFRISTHDTALCEPSPRLVRDFAPIKEARKKIQCGVPLPAVVMGLKKKGYDPILLDAGENDELPSSIRDQSPVRIECTEIYLDERAMMEHVGSKEYMDAYGLVMDPSLMRSTPTTIRIGSPSQHLIERMLEPILKEIVMPGTIDDVFTQPVRSSESNDDTSMKMNHMPIFLSLDISSDDPSKSVTVPNTFRRYCSTCVSMPHILRSNTIRLMCVLTQLPPISVLSELSHACPPIRGEAHTHTDAEVLVRTSLIAAGFTDQLVVNVSASVGYILHERAWELQPIEPRKNAHAKMVNSTAD